VIVRSIIVLLSGCPMYSTQRQQGVIRHNITNMEEKHTQSLRIKRMDRYALTDDDRLKIIEQEHKDAELEQKELDNRIDKLGIRPKPIKCTCLSTHGIDMWTTSKPTDKHVACREPDYNVKMHVFKHFYNCILGSYIIQDCCDIVYDYVGVIYIKQCNIFYWYPESKSEIWTYIPTLGSTFIDYCDDIIIENSINLYKDGDYAVHNGICVVSKCGIKSHKEYLCQEHYDQWQELPITLIHNHKCRECRHIGRCRGYKFRCHGHKVPRKYKCKKCDQKR
jgi:hypothetical protein